MTGHQVDLEALRAMGPGTTSRVARYLGHVAADELEQLRADVDRLARWDVANSAAIERLLAERAERLPDLRSMQDAVRTFAAKAWPGLTVEVEALALAEEVGELARAVVKRAHGNRGTYEDWTAELRREAGDALLVLCNLASLEGFDLAEAGAERLAVILDRDLDHDPVAPTAERCCGREPGHGGVCAYFCSGCTGTGIEDVGPGHVRACTDCDGVGWYDDAGNLLRGVGGLA